MASLLQSRVLFQRGSALADPSDWNYHLLPCLQPHRETWLKTVRFIILKEKGRRDCLEPNILGSKNLLIYARYIIPF